MRRSRSSRTFPFLAKSLTVLPHHSLLIKSSYIGYWDNFGSTSDVLDRGKEVLQGKFYSVTLILTWIIAVALCLCQATANRHPQRWAVLVTDRNYEKNNFFFLLSLKFPKGQDLVRTGNKHQVFLTAGQLCESSLWSPFHRTEAKESLNISRQS